LWFLPIQYNNNQTVVEYIHYSTWLSNDVKYEKLLGITIDNCLSWCQQINNIVSKISSRLGLMCRFQTYLPTEGLIMYYNGYILVFIAISLLVHHPCTFSISSFNLMLMSDMELDEKCIVVSSAYKSDILWSTYRGTSFIYKIKVRGQLCFHVVFHILWQL
jgi:hypothetical protein